MIKEFLVFMAKVLWIGIISVPLIAGLFSAIFESYFKARGKMLTAIAIATSKQGKNEE